MPYWQYTGRSKRFAVEPWLATSRSDSGIRLVKTGTPSTATIPDSPAHTHARNSTGAHQLNELKIAAGGQKRRKFVVARSSGGRHCTIVSPTRPLQAG